MFGVPATARKRMGEVEDQVAATIILQVRISLRIFLFYFYIRVNRPKSLNGRIAPNL
jgi:hypothetical protein